MLGVLIAIVVAAGGSAPNDLPGNCRQVSSDLVECRGYVTRVPEGYRLYPSRFSSRAQFDIDDRPRAGRVVDLIDARHPLLLGDLKGKVCVVGRYESEARCYTDASRICAPLPALHSLSDVRRC